MDKKNLFEMSDDELLRQAVQNTAGWHLPGADKDALHAENVEINRILDERRGESTAFDPVSGMWGARKSKSAGASGSGASGSGSAGAGAFGTGSSGAAGGSGTPTAPRQFSYKAAPEYTSKYQAQIDDLTRQILGRAAFEYDPEADPTYQQYREQYTKNGLRAMQDTLGQVSARTGGLASSYAGSAAQQTYDNYMGELAGKIPELRQLAYEMYRDEGSRQRADLEMLLALEKGDYGRYQDLLSRYNEDRSFDYGVYSDDRAMDYKVARDAVADSQWRQSFDRGVLESDRAFAHDVGREEIDDRRYDREAAAKQAADILASGGMPSEELLAAAGLTGEYAQGVHGAFQREEADEQQALDRAQVDAILQAGGIPSPEMIAASGYSNEYVTAMANAFKREQAEKAAGSRTGGDEGSGTEDYAGLFGAAYASVSPENYIAGHHKEYGFKTATGLSDAYKTWLAQAKANDADAGQYEVPITSETQLGETAQLIAGMIKRMSGDAQLATIAEQIESTQHNGDITPSEADYLVRMLGY